MIEITEYISNDFKALDSEETIVEVQSFFDEVPFSHFSVLKEGVYLGCIAADDVETFDFDKKVSDYKYTLEGFFARINMNWLDVLEIFAKNDCNMVPVLGEDNSYLGYYELEDVVKFLYETPFLKDQGGIIVVEKNSVDYSIGQITQIVESNNGKLLGLFISDASAEKVQVTIKIALGPMNDIIQTFRRYNYEIVSEHQEDNYMNSLKERSEYLDKYLNI
jgi:Mg/Co/Ni transporter MgtE